MKKIMFFVNATGGGTEKASLLIANSLSKKSNLEIYYVSKLDYKNGLSFEKRDEVKYSVLLKRKCNVIGVINELIKFIKINEIDVLISVEPLMGIFTIPATLFSKCEHIIWEHSNFFQNQGSKNIKKIRQIELFMKKNKYVLLTKRDLKNFNTHFKIRCAIDCIYNPMEELCCSNYSMDSKTILSVGHINKIKNFIIIPDIAKKVFNKYPDWKWEIYGSENSKEFIQLRNKINDYELEEHVILCGRDNDLKKVYSNSSIYVMTSLMEGLPMVLLEAKSSKLPIISFDIETGPDEIIRDNVNGFLIPPYDIDIMADKICVLIADSKLRKRFSEKSVLDLEKFNIDTITNEWIKVIEGKNQE